MKIIKKTLLKKKKNRDSQLKYALWEGKVSTKIYIDTFPFQLVYGVDIIFPIHLGVLVMNILQEI